MNSSLWIRDTAVTGAIRLPTRIGPVTHTPDHRMFTNFEIKCQGLHLEACDSGNDARADVRRFIESYNAVRRHSSL